MLDIYKVPIFIFDDKKNDYDIVFCYPEQFEKDHIFLQVDSSRVYRIKVPQPHICSGYLLNCISDTSVLYPMMDEEILIFKQKLFLRKIIKLDSDHTHTMCGKIVAKQHNKSILSKVS